MLIDPEHCYNSWGIYHFKTPYVYKSKISGNIIRVTLVGSDLENVDGSFRLGDIRDDDIFKHIPPKDLKQRIIEHFQDPLADIELLKMIADCYNDYEVVRVD